MQTNFLGFEKQNLDKAKVVVIPVPYEGTVTFLKGTAKGPEAIFSASLCLEEFNHVSGREILEDELFTLPMPKKRFRSPESARNYTEAEVKKVMEAGKFPIVVGGEHSITPGAVSACKEKFPNLSVLYLDAHFDLRNEWNGTPLNHACSARRLSDMGIPITWVGIRSVAMQEAEFVNDQKIDSIFYSPEVPIQEIINTLGENVYISTDFDVFDPSCMPSVGNPQPGGIGWYDAVNLFKEVNRQSNIVGADFTEFSPIENMVHADVFAAKLIFETISLAVQKV